MIQKHSCDRLSIRRSFVKCLISHRILAEGFSIDNFLHYKRPLVISKGLSFISFIFLFQADNLSDLVEVFIPGFRLIVFFLSC